MTSDNTTTACPLCGSREVSDFSRDRRRDYHRCRRCGLVFVPPRQLVSREEEKKRYDLHENSPEDPGYCRSLRRLSDPLQQRLRPGSRGLDFGCGPAPTLSRLFEAAGHAMELFDYFYYRDCSVLDKRFDFITAAEVAEHLREPRTELDRLWSCLNPGGALGIMTKWVVPQEAFSRWHYKNDCTHIRFFSPQTFTWLAGRWSAELSFPDQDVVIFYKPARDIPREGMPEPGSAS